MNGLAYKKIEIKWLLYHWVDIQDSDEKVDIYQALERCCFNYEQCTVLSLYMCNLTSFEIRNILNQHNILIMTPINVLLDEIISMIEESLNVGSYYSNHQTRVIQSGSIYNVLANKDNIIFLPNISMMDSVQYELSKFDNQVQEALNTTYEYVEDDIQLRRQEEMNIRKRYNFLDYERHYHSVCGIEQVMGEQ